MYIFFLHTHYNLAISGELLGSVQTKRKDKVTQLSLVMWEDPPGWEGNFPK